MSPRFAVLLTAAVAFLCGWAFAGPVAAKPEMPIPDAKAELMDADREFAKATHAKGIDGWMTFMANDAVRIAPLGGETHVGTDAVRKHDAAMFKDPKRTLVWEPTGGGAFADGRHGYTTGTSKMLVRNDAGEEEIAWHGAYVTVWRKGDDGKWKVILDTGAEMKPKD
jgi:ketosteroid isomerase-like protein